MAVVVTIAIEWQWCDHGNVVSMAVTIAMLEVVQQVSRLHSGASVCGASTRYYLHLRTASDWWMNWWMN